ncbi:Kdo hydroxylase family protein [Candidatus Rariloculus sp.]|uniref:Kdo hydroxylase family protein n=1 Tax=Candidatus Rariloculus sp. TaxID=3101265 RepID=UPI003D0B5DB0
MTNTEVLRSYSGASVAEIEDALEKSTVVYFDRCPMELPCEDDLVFLREALPSQTRIKNVSYHPESDSVPRFEGSEAAQARVTEILKDHSLTVTRYLQRTIPSLAPGWKVGTCSFRPSQEQGRGLNPRSSNEIVHVDAGAYGATGGDRILRFFVNVNPAVDRVWGTKGSFSSLLERHPALHDAARGDGDRIQVRKRLKDRCYSGLISAVSKAYPLAKVIDSSPYDRAMRRIHNYMKEAEEFRDDPSDYRELRFPPFSAWMVLTDSVSHSVISGQYAFVTTILVPLKNCRQPELAPYYVLESAA